MTAVLEDRIATVTQLRPSRHVSPSQDLHAQLIAESNRLLDMTQTEMDAQDALSELIGGLINLSRGKAVTKRDLVDLMKRKADSLGCPPAVAPVKTRRAR